MIKKLALILIMILSITSFVACGSSNSNDKSSKTENKKIMIGLNQFPTNLDPAIEFNGWFVYEYGMGETLVKFDKDMKIQPVLADSWKSSGNLKYEFHIRDGAKFQNGVAVTAQAVKISIERSIKLNKRAGATLPIASMSADGQNLTITAKTPDAAFLGNVADPVFIIVDASKNTDNYINSPVCTGPFKIKSYAENSQVDVEKYKDYWGSKAKIDLATFKYIKDDNTRSMALQSGEIDVASNITSSNISIFQGNSKYKVDKFSSLRTIMAYENMDNVFLKDPAVRKAVALSFDRETYAKTLLKGTAVPAVGPFPVSLPFGNKSLVGYKYDTALAAKTLADAGYVDTDKDGILEKDGRKLEINIALYTTRAELPVIGEAVQAEFKKIGIKSKIQSYETIAATLKSKKFDIALYSVNTATTGDPQSFLELYFKTGGASNFGGYSNKELDTLLDKLKSEYNTQARHDIAAQAQQIILKDNSYAFIVTPMLNIVSNKKVEGIKMYPVDYYLLDNNVDIK